MALSPPTDIVRLLHGLGEYAPSRYATLLKGYGDVTPEQDPQFYRAISAVNYAGQIKMPVLLIHGTEDLLAPPEHSRWMYDALVKAGNPRVKLELLPGLGHAYEQGFLGYRFDKVVESVSSWFAETLKYRKVSPNYRRESCLREDGWSHPRTWDAPNEITRRQVRHLRGKAEPRVTLRSVLMARTLLALLVALALPVLLISANIHAQSAPRRVGVLIASYQTDRASQAQVAAVRKALSDLGHVEGHDVVIIPVYAEGKPERAADLALGLVRLPVDVALTATIPNALALQKASATLPIVIAAGGDLVGSHLAASVERPGGTVTGIDQLAPGITGKRLGLLKEVSPGMTRVAILSTAPSASHALQSTDAEAAAKNLGISLRIYRV